MSSASPKLPDLKTIRVVSWDVDGTLYSNRRAARHATMSAAMLSIRRIRLSPLGELRELAGLWRRVESARADLAYVSRVRAGASRRHELETRWWVPAVATVGPRPGVKELLGYLRTHVGAQVILSDYEADAKLQALGLADYIDRAYVGERIGFFKPSPVPFTRIIEDYEIEPECLLHIGDRVDTDGAGAAAAGCKSLVIRKDFRSFGELYTMLASDCDRWPNA